MLLDGGGGASWRAGRRPNRKEAPPPRRRLPSGDRLPGLNHTRLPLTFEPVAFPGDRYDLCVVQQTIKQCRRQRGILRKGGIPLAKRQVAGDDQAALLVARGNDLEEQVGLLAAHRQIADFVDDQQAVR